MLLSKENLKTKCGAVVAVFYQNRRKQDHEEKTNIWFANEKIHRKRKESNYENITHYLITNDDFPISTPDLSLVEVTNKKVYKVFVPT